MLDNLYACQTNPATDLRAAQGADVPASLSLHLPGSVGAGRTGRCRVRGLTIVSVDQAAWEVWLWGTKDYMSPSLANSQFLGRWAFDASDGIQIAGSDSYHYAIHGLDVLYQDLDDLATKTAAQANARLHFSLVPRNATSKASGDAGMVLVRFLLQPTHS